MWTRSAAASQVSGYALPLIVAFATRRVSAMLAVAEGWARIAAWAACAGSVWLAVISPDIVYVIAPVVLFVPIAVVLRKRARTFTAEEFALLPALLVVYFAPLDLTARRTAPADRGGLVAVRRPLFSNQLRVRTARDHS
ncbi:MAG TPA: hypothetical protein VH087_03435 [Thermoanaerobaculia bacterium]|jgi:hypothetical protein|nr:hypothetical protein [Thermoanaerobaculia bacterium]